jgi:hypothetical protein
MRRDEENDSKAKVVIRQYHGGYEIGFEYDDGMFIAMFNRKTKKEAKAAVANFDALMERDFNARIEAEEAEENEENERFPNLAHVRAKIKELRDSGKPDEAFDALQKLRELKNLDIHERIEWPLPSWQDIESGRVYGR